MSEEITKKLEQVSEDVAGLIKSKASTFSVSAVLIIGAVFAGIYFNSTFFLELAKTQSKVESLQAAHDHCHEELAKMQEKLDRLEGELNVMKARVATN